MESSTEGGHVMIRLGNDESLGRELRTYLQTEKYVRHKNDGTLPESAKRILRGFSEDNQERRNDSSLCSARCSPRLTTMPRASSSS